MKRREMLYIVIVFLLLTAPAIPAPLAAAVLPQDSTRNIFELMERGRQENKFHATVEMEIIDDNNPKTFRKDVWADFPKYYREDLLDKPENPELLRWILRRKMSFLFSRDMFPPPPDFLDEPGSPDMRRRPRGNTRPRREMFFERLLRAFNPSVADGGLVADRRVFNVIMEPKRLPRPKIMFWIDREYGTILREEFFRNEDGAWVLRYRENFVSIVYNPEFPENTFTEEHEFGRHFRDRMFSGRNAPEIKELTGAEEIGSYISFHYTIPGNIPEGFSLERIRVIKGEMGETLHLHYSDGVYAFSIFESIGELPPPFDGAMRRNRSRSGEITSLQREGRTILFKELSPVNYLIVGNCPESILLPVFNELQPD